MQIVPKKVGPSAPIADQKHRFFEGETFNAVLRAVHAQPRKFKVYEKGGTLRVSVQDVKNVHRRRWRWRVWWG